MLVPALLTGRDCYERTLRASIDNLHDDALTHTVRITDDDRALEVTVLARPAPSYAIREARLTPLAGRIAPAVVTGFAGLAGVEMVGGLTRRTAEAVGDGAGAPLAVDAMIEVARLARQVGKMPRAEGEQAAAGALACWVLDTRGWPDLPDSCFTYSAAGRALFGTRPIATPMRPDLYSPRRGQRRVFVRRKVARLERLDHRLVLFHSMHDNVHGFEIVYEIDATSGRVLRAEHVTPKLPYAGICSEPQRKIAALVGEVADAGLRKRIAPLIGGATGCAQLYDLTADVLKLLGA